MTPGSNKVLYILHPPLKLPGTTHPSESAGQIRAGYFTTHGGPMVQAKPASGCLRAEQLMLPSTWPQRY
eukprot:188891-Hanusia_phi.AAC.1